MKTVYFITHPDVVIDPEIPAPQWPLSARGIERIRRMLHQPWIKQVSSVYCSGEQKAIDGAQLLADYLGIDYHTYETLGEVDRSSTGYLPEDEFWPVVNQLYDNPDESIQGWESASAAQQRIIEAVQSIMDGNDNDGSIAIIAHGLVGALYLGHLKGVSIQRELEQPATNGGNYFAFDAETQELHHDWQPINDAQEGMDNLSHCPNPDCRFLADTGMIAEFDEEMTDCPDCGSSLVAGAAPPAIKRKSAQSRLWSNSELLATVGTFESEDEAYESKEELNGFGIMSIVVESELPVIREDDGGKERQENDEPVVPKGETVFALQVARFDVRRAYEILGVPAESEYELGDDYWDELEKAGFYEADDGDDDRADEPSTEEREESAEPTGETNQLLMIVGVIALFVVIGFFLLMFR